MRTKVKMLKNLSFGLSSSESRNFTEENRVFFAQGIVEDAIAEQKSRDSTSKSLEYEGVKPKTQVQADSSYLDKEVVVKGWIRTLRPQKNCTFLELNDGSTLSSLQIVLEPHLVSDALTTGASVEIKGKVVASPSGKQKVEIQATEVNVIGLCPVEEYPLQKKRHSFEFLRTIAHLRARTNTFGAITRVRNSLAISTHNFFQKRGFYYIHTPLITLSDCEGGGKLFQVTTLDDSLSKRDYTLDFFGKPAFLTVSGQLNAESYACALSDVYTFGPTFRAENSHTSRHLAEFWMIEPEMAFADIYDDMDLAQEYLKSIFKDLLENCYEEMEFFDAFVRQGVIERLKKIVEGTFERITYTDAVNILKKATKKFEFPCEWGCDLQSEHERYLCEEYFKCPVIVRDYPEAIKAFYMRNNDDGKTVAAMDVLVPDVGEIIGGSQREDRLPILQKKMEKVGLNPEEYFWYLELRKYGSVPHAGFGAGFERLVLFASGMENIRDVIAFPRTPGHAEF